MVMDASMKGTAPPAGRWRLLVVGGSGFIGRQVVARAVGMSWDVTILSLHGRLHPAPSVRAIQADVADATSLQAALRGLTFDYVVNCAGYIDHSSYRDGARRVLNAHLGGVLNLAELLPRDSLRSFVNLGSSDEYGAAPAPQSELQREQPFTPYSFAKTAAAQFLQMLHRSEGLPATTLRLFLTYGPGQDERRFIPQLIAGCLSGSAFPVSAGEQLRDFCYVSDTVDAVFAALTTPAAWGQIINVASGQPVPLRQLIETVRELIGSGEPQFGQVAYRQGENMELYADTRKVVSILGWTPRTSLASGLRQTIQWYRETH
jgi:nucleoside-diphosphate-sugar epimerase